MNDLVYRDGHFYKKFTDVPFTGKVTELENIGCPEAVTADIVGHKKQTITYGLYSGGNRLELMRDWIEKIQYPVTGQSMKTATV